MKFLIIFLVSLSCSVIDDTVVEETEYVETDLEPMEYIEKSLEHMEGVHFTTLEAYADNIQTVVQIVQMRKANTYDIVKVWYTHNVFKNSGLLGKEEMYSVVITVQSLKKGHYNFDRQYVRVMQADSVVIDKVSQELKNIAQQKFFEIVKLLANNEVI